MMKRVQVSNPEMLKLLKEAGFSPCWKCEYCGHLNECNEEKCSICGCPYPEQDCCSFSTEEILYALLLKAKEVAEWNREFDQMMAETSAGNFIPYIVSDYYYSPYTRKLQKGELSERELKRVAEAVLNDLFGGDFKRIEKEYGKEILRIFEKILSF